ncbi:MAG: phosphate ABC transporter permease [Acidimicrobiales bacterium]|nr:MAG: phosphate ABC transporter permease [Acidimicrobiales bacterium]
MVAPTVVAPPLVVIEPERGWSPLRLRDVWRSRDLLYFIAWRDIKVRYTQAILGAGWAVIQPLLLVAVFSVVLGRLAKIPSEGVPYIVFAFAGLVPWTFFSNGVAVASESLVSSSNLVSKVYFPRLVIPIGSLLAWLPDLAIASLMLLILMLAHGLIPAWTTVLLPLLGGFALLAAVGVSLWLSALNVYYRDVRYAVPFFLQIGLFATPIVYPPTLVPPALQPLLGVDPMSGVVEGFRWSVIGTTPNWSIVAISGAVTVILLGSGLYYFRRMERTFADVV